MVTGGVSDLFITDTEHAAKVSVDESGTKAAAATAVVMGHKSAATPSVTFDRPFVFVIRDRLTGEILFMGRVESL
jgi:serpin B